MEGVARRSGSLGTRQPAEGRARVEQRCVRRTDRADRRGARVMEGRREDGIENVVRARRAAETRDDAGRTGEAPARVQGEWNGDGREREPLLGWRGCGA